MRHRGFSAWDIKTGPFAPWEADLVKNISIVKIFILGSPIPYHPREWKLEKGIHTPGHSNWTICSL